MKRAWSQEHLAQVSGLGLRTIQRIENRNSASFESIKSIASSLQIDLDQLINETPNRIDNRSQRFRLSLGAMGFICAALAGFGVALVTNMSFADQVMLDVGLVVNSEEAHEASLLTKDGKEAEIRLDDVLRFIVTPAIQNDGRVFLHTKVFAYENGQYSLWVNRSYSPVTTKKPKSE
ncbi:MAG: helix-turn-helix domain-containing protein [Gammaproteobacteria bacterium]